MTLPILSTRISSETDVVFVRQRARRIAERLGFDAQDQTRIATAVSEIARNAFAYAGGGRAEFLADLDRQPQELVVRITDHGQGIPHLATILEGRYRSLTGMGLGIIGAKRLMDGFDIQTSPGGGVAVEMRKKRSPRLARLPASALSTVAAAVGRELDSDPMTALRDQNRELVASLSELKDRNEELEKLGRELEDTNRGVVALYSELDEKAEQLRQASELKTRFLSNMSHEFRTPLNSILAISRMLQDRIDGDLTPEQMRQVGYIRQSAEHLTELVNDLLDLAKVEAGKLDVRTSRFSATELFGGLRGAMRPLQTTDRVALVFEDADGVPLLCTDEGKVAQILRNFISNALKYTEVGSVVVSAAWDEARDRVSFAVADTGIGIAPGDRGRIFDEFVQLENRLQARSKGTGLGLPLSRKLAQLLRGDVTVASVPGQGSTFTLTIPPHYAEHPAIDLPAGSPRQVLVADDDESFRYIVRQLIGSEGRFELAEARNGVEALESIRRNRPDVLLLDVQMPELDGPAVLQALQDDPDTRSLPVIMSTSHVIDPELRSRLSSARALLSKDALSRDVLLSLLAGVAGPRA
jgi:signal transduction histidine kinase/CheY-like chemotaxis protein